MHASDRQTPPRLYCAAATRIHCARLTDSYLPANLCLIYSPMTLVVLFNVRAITPLVIAFRLFTRPPGRRVSDYYRDCSLVSYEGRGPLCGRLQVERGGRSHSVTALLFAIETSASRICTDRTLNTRSRTNFWRILEGTLFATVDDIFFYLQSRVERELNTRSGLCIVLYYCILTLSLFRTYDVQSKKWPRCLVILLCKLFILQAFFVILLDSEKVMIQRLMIQSLSFVQTHRETNRG